MVPMVFLLQNIFTSIILVIICVLAVLLIINRKVRQKATPTLILFFVYLVIYNFTATFNRIYTIIVWNPQKVVYNQQIIYLLTIFPWILRRSSTLFETMLCIERCLVVAFPLRYSHRWKWIIFILVIELFLVFSITSIIGNNLIEKFPKTPDGLCTNFLCIINAQGEKYLMFLSLTELIAAIILLIVIKLKYRSSMIGKRTNLAVIVLVFTSLMFEFTPNFIDQIYIFFTGETLANIIGTFQATFSSIGVLISVVTYYYIFTRTKKPNQINAVSPES